MHIDKQIYLCYNNKIMKYHGTDNHFLTYHPSEFLEGKYFDGLKTISELINDPSRVQRIGESITSQALLADILMGLDNVSAMSFGTNNTRELIMVHQQMGLDRDDLNEYRQLTKSLDDLPELVEWFDGKETEVRRRRRVSDLKATKGLAISLGAEVHAGLWPEKGESLLDDGIRALPAALEGHSRFTVTPTRRKKNKLSFKMAPIIVDGSSTLFARLERNRAVADINTPDKVLHVVKRSISLVAASELPKKTRDRYWDGVPDWRRDPKWEDAIESVGRINEVSRANAEVGLGVIPSDSSYYLRAPLQ